MRGPLCRQKALSGGSGYFIKMRKLRHSFTAASYAGCTSWLRLYRLHLMRENFVFEASSPCSNVVPLLKKYEHRVLVFTRHYESRNLDDATEVLSWM